MIPKKIIAFIIINIFTMFSYGSELDRVCPQMPDVSSKALTKISSIKQPDRGPLWEIKKKDRISYIYGTIHVAKIEWDFPGPTIKAALDASQAVAVELDLTNPALAERMNNASTASVRGREAQVGAIKTDENLSKRITEQFKKACIDESRFQNASLNSKVTSLVLLSAREDGLYPNFAIDSAIVGYAKATGKSVMELETANEQGSALESGSSSLESAITRLESGRAAADLKILTDAWANSPFEKMEDYFSWCECESERKTIEKLLVNRNSTLAKRIAEIENTKSNVFFAVGVLHLIGEGSVLSRLREDGYSVKQLTSLKKKP